MLTLVVLKCVITFAFLILIPSGSCQDPDIDACASNPCQNDGTCTDAADGYSCACVPGYTGANCETDDSIELAISVDDQLNMLYVDGNLMPRLANWDNCNVPKIYWISKQFLLITAYGINVIPPYYGIIARIGDYLYYTDTQHWKCLSQIPEAGSSGWSNSSDWIQPFYDDTKWPTAINSSKMDPVADINFTATWIWQGDTTVASDNCYCRFTPYNLTCLREYACYNGGTCRFDVDSLDCYCDCPEYTTGAHCETDFACLQDTSFCLHGGTVAFSDKNDTCYCKCPQKYCGKYCESKVPPHHTTDLQCLNGGSLEDGVCHCRGMNVGKYCGCYVGGFVGALIILAIIIILLLIGLLILFCLLRKRNKRTDEREEREERKSFRSKRSRKVASQDSEKSKKRGSHDSRKRKESKKMANEDSEKGKNVTNEDSEKSKEVAVEDSEKSKNVTNEDPEKSIAVEGSEKSKEVANKDTEKSKNEENKESEKSKKMVSKDSDKSKKH